MVKLSNMKGKWTPPSDVLNTTRPTNSTAAHRAAVTKSDQTRASTPAAETPMPPLNSSLYKKYPTWDFEDVYNQDAKPRQTTCAQSLRNSQDESFKKAFLPNIRLYLHKDNFNMSEWNRLSHFNNPFGFMGFHYKDVIEAIKLIPEPKEPLFPPKLGGDGCVRCAVVGTGGILNGSKKGKEIDDHDYVIRMNGALIKNHEEDVGNRTSVYVHTAHSITTSRYLLRKYGYTNAPADEGIKYVMIPEGMRDFQWLIGLLKRERVAAGQYRNNRPWTYYSNQFNESRFYVLHPDFLRYVRNRFLKSPALNRGYWRIVRPTNGAFALFVAVHTCDIVSAYGFITDDHSKYNNYYYDKGTKTHVIFYSNHDYNLEKDTWKKLHNTKIMKLYQNHWPSFLGYKYRGKGFNFGGLLKSWNTRFNLVSQLDGFAATTVGATSPDAETPMPPLDIESFKKYPVWDFEDIYNQDAPPRKTTCAQSVRNSQDESFKKAFLPNIRLYLHKDNFNMSEWNRLSHFNSPFGFMGFHYKDVIEAIKLIPEPKEPLFPPKLGGDGCVRCAVVATGGILNGSKKGKEIDDHDYVIRMNGALTKNHEEDVGNRTSVYVHTAHAIIASSYLLSKDGKPPADKGIKYVMIPEAMRDFHWLTGLMKRERVAAGPYRNDRPWTYYSNQFNESRFYVLHPDFLRYVRNRFLKSPNLNKGFWRIVRPTNGAFALFVALHTCDIVSAYGFITDDYSEYNNYYYDEGTKTHVIFYSNHDYNLEKDAWKKLHNTKIMKLYQNL
ncbi:alpha-N-acetylgalactosaminide alpha-2%2C6-sialyltransferase 1-like isoform X1 [Xyrichtys novacula]|uniref:alpha-N-acetylgalactosaminide alpha-2,6-sialyltransferase n=1 Tax=Xyrichtys novacula TaxID=13765 RepID=A0AAV1H2Z2_XYRNO|nr:alpha-N-acetylgalactosaminide alpha-2%2C6-sialyltransferase 1-like isoform X1 [Xyrichtys novacula]